MLIRSPVETSGTMQSKQNRCLHLWHCLKRLDERTLPQIQHSSLMAITAYSRQETPHGKTRIKLGWVLMFSVNL
jgi:hypothetical protein